MSEGRAAIVLAGGRGTRLQPTVTDRPKVLAEVAGRPFLDHLLGRIEKTGIREVVICIGFMADAVRAQYAQGFGQLTLRFSHEEIPLGTGGAVRLAVSESAAETFLVMNGDSYCTANLADFQARAEASDCDRAMLLVHCEDCRDYGRVETDAKDRVVAYHEKDGSPASGWVNAGVYQLSRRAVESIPAGRAVSIEREVFPAWIPGGVAGLRMPGTFLDIGTPERYAAAEQFFAENAL